ncbi:MAG: GNAT family N-acetyltransferase [Pseudomonadota bacterium]
MNNTQLLNWDSDILGISVAKILPSPLTTEKLALLLQELKSQRVKLVYWLVASEDIVSQKAAQHCAGFLADKKITYCVDLRTLSPLPSARGVEIYTSDTANSELKTIATEIGRLSRFGNDPHLTVEQVNRLYKAWINNACKKTVAKIVLVTKNQHNIVGVVTIDEKQGRGDLSLLGVDPQHQSKGIGKRLVHAAQAWCLANDYPISQVVTQQGNIKACRLYESCSYQQEKTEYFYHFWL